MPQALLVQLRAETVGLPCGPQELAPPPLVSGAPQPQHQILTCSATSTLNLTAVAGARFLFVGFDDTNTQLLRLGAGLTDIGVAIGPTGWAGVTLPLLTVAQTVTLFNPGGTSVTVEIYVA